MTEQIPAAPDPIRPDLAIHDPAKLERAAQIIRGALARNKVTLADLAPAAPDPIRPAHDDRLSEREKITAEVAGWPPLSDAMRIEVAAILQPPASP